MCYRCQGIWNSIKNDEELFKDEQCARDVINFSLWLSKKLSKKSESSCKEFLQDLSSSIFFIALRGFIENHAERYVLVSCCYYEITDKVCDKLANFCVDLNHVDPLTFGHLETTLKVAVFSKSLGHTHTCRIFHSKVYLQV